MGFDFGLWVTIGFSLLGFAVSVLSLVMRGKEERTVGLPSVSRRVRMLLSAAKSASNASALALVLLSTLLPWHVRTFILAENLRVRSHEAAIQEVFSANARGPQLYRAFARGLLVTMEKEYKSLTSGDRVSVMGYNESTDLYKQFITASCAKGNTLRATSLIRSSSWAPDLRQVNREFLDRGGAVRRIFVCLTQEQKTQAMAEIRLQHDGCRSAGKTCPELMLLDLGILESQDAAIKDVARDFILNVEEKVAIEFRVADGQIIGAVLICDENEIDRLLRDHVRLENKSAVISPN